MEFAFLEMIAADPLVRATPKTERRLKSVESDRPLGAQLVGCNPGSMGPAAAILEEMGFDLIDINMGCPVSKVISPGGGSALLTKPEKARDIFKEVVSHVKKVPVTVKMRKGFSDESGDEAVRIAQIAEDEGLSAVTVHGRTRVQGYSGQADWNAIGKVKRAVKIPVFGNGDVATPEDAKRCLETSGCDGVMLGRGALGNPWIYRAIDAALQNRPTPPTPTLVEKKKAALKHLEYELETEGERIAALKCRRIICWYFKNYRGIHEFRQSINRSQSSVGIRDLILGFNPEQAHS